MPPCPFLAPPWEQALYLKLSFKKEKNMINKDEKMNEKEIEKKRGIFAIRFLKKFKITNTITGILMP